MLLESQNDRLMLTDKAYAIGKRLAQVFLPAISALYYGLAKIWGFPHGEDVVGTLALLGTFLGVTLHISSSQYDNSGAGVDGTVHVIDNDEGSAVNFNVNPTDLVNKDQITLKVTSPTKAKAKRAPRKSTK